LPRSGEGEYGDLIDGMRVPGCGPQPVGKADSKSRPRLSKVLKGSSTRRASAGSSPALLNCWRIPERIHRKLGTRAEPARVSIRLRARSMRDMGVPDRGILLPTVKRRMGATRSE
jgi:hypothetical protein